MTTEITLSQLLCSRLCHDLVGAAGAINAGIELLNEDASDISAPLRLMETSAEQVTRRLSFFRVAFGSAGGPESPVDAPTLQKLIADYLSDKKVGIKWNALSFDGVVDERVSTSGKLLCLMMVLASDCLPRGGEITVHLAPLDDGIGIAVEGKGTDVRVSELLQLALNATHLNEHISARNVHAYFANQLALGAQGSLELESDGATVQIACVLPGGVVTG